MNLQKRYKLKKLLKIALINARKQTFITPILETLVGDIVELIEEPETISEGYINGKTFEGEII